MNMSYTTLKQLTLCQLLSQACGHQATMIARTAGLIPKPKSTMSYVTLEQSILPRAAVPPGIRGLIRGLCARQGTAEVCFMCVMKWVLLSTQGRGGLIGVTGEVWSATRHQGADPGLLRQARCGSGADVFMCFAMQERDGLQIDGLSC